MSYTSSAALQKAVFAALSGSATLSDAVSGAIFDAAPTGAIPALYVSLGPEVVRDRSDISGSVARHEFTVAVVAAQGGFVSAKEIAVLVNEVLSDADLALERGQLRHLIFVRASAKRGTGDERRIDLVFRACVDDH